MIFMFIDKELDRQKVEVNNEVKCVHATHTDSVRPNKRTPS